MIFIKFVIIIIEYSFLLIKNVVDVGVINNVIIRIIFIVWIFVIVINESNNIIK